MRQGLTVVPTGLVLVLVVSMLGAGGPAAPPDNGIAVLDERFGQPVAPIFLLLRPDVQLDLELNRRQVAGARALVSQLVDSLLRVKNKTGPAALEERRRIDDAMADWLHHELAEAQLDRLTQIIFQWEGASAMRRPSVVEYLGLGEAQRLRIDRLLIERDRRHAARVLSPAEFDRLTREALAALTPLQKQQWTELLGPPCHFSIGHPAAPPRNPAAVPDVKSQARPPGR